MDLANLPPEQAAAATTGLVFAALTAIGGFVLICLSIWDKFRRKPSVDVSLAGLATKGELKGTKVDLTDDINKVETRLSLKIEANQAERSRRDGKLFDLIRDTDSELRELIETKFSASTKEMGDINKEIGRLVGLLEAQRKR